MTLNGRFQTRPDHRTTNPRVRRPRQLPLPEPPPMVPDRVIVACSDCGSTNHRQWPECFCHCTEVVPFTVPAE